MIDCLSSGTNRTSGGVASVAAVVLSTLLAGVTFVTNADAKLIMTGRPEASFTAVGPGGLKIVGTTSEVQTSDDAEKVVVSVALSNLTTGIGLRDKHMRETYLEVQKFPQAVLQASRSALKIPSAQEEVQASAQGWVTIHGQTRPVEFRYTARRGGDHVHVNGSMRVNMKDFGIPVPSYMGVSVKPETDIAIKFEVVED